MEFDNFFGISAARRSDVDRVDFMWMTQHYETYVFNAIRVGLEDCRNGRCVTISELREVYGGYDL